MNDILLPQRTLWKFHVDISIGSVSGRGCQEGGYLEDIEGSWPETWRTGLFLTSWMVFFYPKEDTLKISCWYLNQKCVRKGGSRRGVLGGRWGFLTGDMEDMVIPDVINDVFYPKKHTLKILCWCLNWKWVKKGVQEGGTWRALRVPDRRLGGLGNSWRHEWCFFTPR